MAKVKSFDQGTVRTRDHVIADLAVNHVEKQALLGGGTIERIRFDYGIDLILFTFTPAGVIETSNIYVQVKGSERLKWLRHGGHASFRIDRSHLVGWLAQLLPVILIVYDATEDRAYWLHVQGHFASLPGFNLFRAGKTLTVHLDARQRLEPASIRTFADLRDAVKGQTTQQ